MFRRLFISHLAALRDQRGASAVEFALLAPVLITMYFGCVEIGVALTVDRKMSTVVSTVSDLVAQAEDVDAAEIDGVFDAARAIMSPFDDASLQMRVSSVQIDAASKATVDWSRARNMSALQCDIDVALPATVVDPGMSLVMAEVEMDFVSPIASVLFDSFSMSRTFYSRPRQVDSVPFLPSSECAEPDEEAGGGGDGGDGGDDGGGDDAGAGEDSGDDDSGEDSGGGGWGGGWCPGWAWWC